MTATLLRCAIACLTLTLACTLLVDETTTTPSANVSSKRSPGNEWFDEYDDEDDEDDDDDDDDGQYYDDETEEELQADYYRQPFGNAPSKKVDQFWNSYRPSHRTRMHKLGAVEDPKDVEDVKRHHDQVSSRASCRIPRPKVVRALDHHPSTTKTYLPSCTILHQCSEDTGCCPANQRCGPSKTEKLDLPFYSVQVVPTMSHYAHRKVKIERLVFYNHTECQCQVRSDDMPRDVLPTDPPEVAKCVCPSPFNVRPLGSGRCACDCFDKQIDCIKFKKGKDYLNHDDRLCIEMKKCLTPSCDYGNYIRRSGRCPRKDEKYRY